MLQCVICTEVKEGGASGKEDERVKNSEVRVHVPANKTKIAQGGGNNEREIENQKKCTHNPKEVLNGI